MPLSIILKSTISYIFESIRFRKKKSILFRSKSSKTAKIFEPCKTPTFQTSLKVYDRRQSGTVSTAPKLKRPNFSTPLLRGVGDFCTKPQPLGESPTHSPSECNMHRKKGIRKREHGKLYRGFGCIFYPGFGRIGQRPPLQSNLRWPRHTDSKDSHVCLFSMDSHVCLFRDVDIRPCILQCVPFVYSLWNVRALSEIDVIDTRSAHFLNSSNSQRGMKYVSVGK